MRYYLIDSETTGVDESAAACEIGWIELDEDFNILSQRETLLDPQRPISHAASGVHGLVYEDVANSPTIAEFFSVTDDTCYGRKLEGPAVLIGHKVAFDVRFMGPYVESPFSECCSLRWARRLWPDADNHQLSTLKYMLGLPRDLGTAHRVMADVMTTYWLTRKICEVAGLTLPQLVEASQESFLLDRVPWGKHKGDKFTSVPRSYLSWMLGTAEADRDLTFTLETLLNKKKS